MRTRLAACFFMVSPAFAVASSLQADCVDLSGIWLGTCHQHLGEHSLPFEGGISILQTGCLSMRLDERAYVFGSPLTSRQEVYYGLLESRDLYYWDKDDPTVLLGELASYDRERDSTCGYRTHEVVQAVRYQLIGDTLHSVIKVNDRIRCDDNVIGRGASVDAITCVYRKTAAE